MIRVALLSLLLTITGVKSVQAWQPWNGHQLYPTAYDYEQNITYQGVYESEVEAFLGIRYGFNTSGQNRFKHPTPYTYAAGSTVDADTIGPFCPQPPGASFFPVYLTNATNTSEDCLLLNVKRPNGTTSDAKLPVMVFIHGGSFYIGSKDELISLPEGLILQSVYNGAPVMHVGLNYRLGSLGFAYNEALQAEGSTNAGLRDQRLALEWVQSNIAAFGGDPDKVTIFGQSSGGLAIGLQVMAYGGAKPAPFHQAIAESQCLENGITGGFQTRALTRLTAAVGCNTTDLQSAETIQCLRNLPIDQLITAQTATHLSNGAGNIGDEWLPTVDGDFLPDAPSQLIAQGRFTAVNATIGWCDGDIDIFPPMTIKTAADTNAFFRDYLPSFTNASFDTLYSLYPVTDFHANPGANLSAEYYRTSRIIRDVLMACPSILYSAAIAHKGGLSYLYDQNQTFLNPALTSLGLPHLGVIHTSEFAYVFGNLSHYDVDGFPFEPNATDYALLQRESRSWSSFAAFGLHSLPGRDTLQGWGTAYQTEDNVGIYVIGGPEEGLFEYDGGANEALDRQRLSERCAFLNSPEIIAQLDY